MGLYKAPNLTNRMQDFKTKGDCSSDLRKAARRRQGGRGCTRGRAWHKTYAPASLLLCCTRQPILHLVLVLEYTMNDAVLKWTSQHTLHLLLYCTWYYAGMLYLVWWLTWLEQVGACLVLDTTTLGTQYYNTVLECTRGTILYSVPCHAMLQSRSTHPI